MAAVLESKLKKRGSEKANSTREKIKVTHLRVLPFSLLMKRRTKAPRMGKKISSDRMGILKIVMKPTPFPLNPSPPPLPTGSQALRRGGVTSPFGNLLPVIDRQKGIEGDFNKKSLARYNRPPGRFLQ
jgi:hypothetical protein